jgi:hypothetical protein
MHNLLHWILVQWSTFAPHEQQFHLKSQGDHLHQELPASLR